MGEEEEGEGEEEVARNEVLEVINSPLELLEEYVHIETRLLIQHCDLQDSRVKQFNIQGRNVTYRTTDGHKKRLTYRSTVQRSLQCDLESAKRFRQLTILQGLQLPANVSHGQNR